MKVGFKILLKRLIKIRKLLNSTLQVNGSKGFRKRNY